jgi:hypothetical protein
MCEPVAITLLPHTVHELTDRIAKRKYNRLLTVDYRPPELRLNAIVLGDERVVECLFYEDGSHFTVRHRPILAVLWCLMTSV